MQQPTQSRSKGNEAHQAKRRSKARTGQVDQPSKAPPPTKGSKNAERKGGDSSGNRTTPTPAPQQPVNPFVSYAQHFLSQEPLLGGMSLEYQQQQHFYPAAIASQIGRPFPRAYHNTLPYGTKVSAQTMTTAMREASNIVIACLPSSTQELSTNTDQVSGPVYPRQQQYNPQRLYMQDSLFLSPPPTYPSFQGDGLLVTHPDADKQVVRHYKENIAKTTGDTTTTTTATTTQYPLSNPILPSDMKRRLERRLAENLHNFTKHPNDVKTKTLSTMTNTVRPLANIQPIQPPGLPLGTTRPPAHDELFENNAVNEYIYRDTAHAKALHRFKAAQQHDKVLMCPPSLDDSFYYHHHLDGTDITTMYLFKKTPSGARSRALSLNLSKPSANSQRSQELRGAVTALNRDYNRRALTRYTAWRKKYVSKQEKFIALPQDELIQRVEARLDSFRASVGQLQNQSLYQLLKRFGDMQRQLIDEFKPLETRWRELCGKSIEKTPKRELVHPKIQQFAFIEQPYIETIQPSTESHQHDKIPQEFLLLDLPKEFTRLNPTDISEELLQKIQSVTPLITFYKRCRRLVKSRRERAKLNRRNELYELRCRAKKECPHLFPPGFFRDKRFKQDDDRGKDSAPSSDTHSNAHDNNMTDEPTTATTTTTSTTQQQDNAKKKGAGTKGPQKNTPVVPTSTLPGFLLPGDTYDIPNENVDLLADQQHTMDGGDQPWIRIPFREHNSSAANTSIISNVIEKMSPHELCSIVRQEKAFRLLLLDSIRQQCDKLLNFNVQTNPAQQPTESGSTTTSASTTQGSGAATTKDAGKSKPSRGISLDSKTRRQQNNRKNPRATMQGGMGVMRVGENYQATNIPDYIPPEQRDHEKDLQDPPNYWLWSKSSSSHNFNEYGRARIHRNAYTMPLFVDSEDASNKDKMHVEAKTHMVQHQPRCQCGMGDTSNCIMKPDAKYTISARLVQTPSPWLRFRTMTVHSEGRGSICYKHRCQPCPCNDDDDDDDNNDDNDTRGKRTKPVDSDDPYNYDITSTYGSHHGVDAPRLGLGYLPADYHGKMQLFNRRKYVNLRMEADVLYNVILREFQRIYDMGGFPNHGRSRTDANFANSNPSEYLIPSSSPYLNTAYPEPDVTYLAIRNTILQSNTADSSSETQQPSVKLSTMDDTDLPSQMPPQQIQIRNDIAVLSAYVQLLDEYTADRILGHESHFIDEVHTYLRRPYPRTASTRTSCRCGAAGCTCECQKTRNHAFMQTQDQRHARDRVVRQMVRDYGIDLETDRMGVEHAGLLSATSNNNFSKMLNLRHYGKTDQYAVRVKPPRKRSLAQALLTSSPFTADYPKPPAVDVVHVKKITEVVPVEAVIEPPDAKRARPRRSRTPYYDHNTIIPLSEQIKKEEARKEMIKRSQSQLNRKPRFFRTPLPPLRYQLSTAKYGQDEAYHHLFRYFQAYSNKQARQSLHVINKRDDFIDTVQRVSQRTQRFKHCVWLTTKQSPIPTRKEIDENNSKLIKSLIKFPIFLASNRSSTTCTCCSTTTSGRTGCCLRIPSFFLNGLTFYNFLHNPAISSPFHLMHSGVTPSRRVQRYLGYILETLEQVEMTYARRVQQQFNAVDSKPCVLDYIPSEYLRNQTSNRYGSRKRMPRRETLRQRAGIQKQAPPSPTTSNSNQQRQARSARARPPVKPAEPATSTAAATASSSSDQQQQPPTSEPTKVESTMSPAGATQATQTTQGQDPSPVVPQEDPSQAQAPNDLTIGSAPTPSYTYSATPGAVQEPYRKPVLDRLSLYETLQRTIGKITALHPRSEEYKASSVSAQTKTRGRPRLELLCPIRYNPYTVFKRIPLTTFGQLIDMNTAVLSLPILSLPNISSMTIIKNLVKNQQMLQTFKNTYSLLQKRPALMLSKTDAKDMNDMTTTTTHDASRAPPSLATSLATPSAITTAITTDRNRTSAETTATPGTEQDPEIQRKPSDSFEGQLFKTFINEAVKAFPQMTADRDIHDRLSVYEATLKEIRNSSTGERTVKFAAHLDLRTRRVVSCLKHYPYGSQRFQQSNTLELPPVAGVVQGQSVSDPQNGSQAHAHTDMNDESPPPPIAMTEARPTITLTRSANTKRSASSSTSTAASSRSGKSLDSSHPHPHPPPPPNISFTPPMTAAPPPPPLNPSPVGSASASRTTDLLDTIKVPAPTIPRALRRTMEEDDDDDDGGLTLSPLVYHESHGDMSDFGL